MYNTISFKCKDLKQKKLNIKDGVKSMDFKFIAFVVFLTAISGIFFSAYASYETDTIGYTSYNTTGTDAQSFDEYGNVLSGFADSDIMVISVFFGCLVVLLVFVGLMYIRGI